MSFASRLSFVDCGLGRSRSVWLRRASGRMPLSSATSQPANRSRVVPASRLSAGICRSQSSKLRRRPSGCGADGRRLRTSPPSTATRSRKGSRRFSARDRGRGSLSGRIHRFDGSDVLTTESHRSALSVTRPASAPTGPCTPLVTLSWASRRATTVGRRLKPIRLGPRRSKPCPVRTCDPDPMGSVGSSWP
jgi:hypothetical protein